MIETRSKSSVLFDIFNYTIVTLFALMCVLPFYYMLCYSFSDPTIAAKGITFWPKGFTLQNYKTVMQLEEIPRAAVISVLRTLLGAGITLICCGFFAYLMTQQRMYFRKFIYRFVVITMYVSGGMIPTYLIIRMLGLRNSFLVYILPSAMSAYYIMLIKTSIEQLPSSLEEAARLEGCGVFTCWWKVILPLTLPIMATIGVFAMVAQWNSWFDALLYVTDESLQPLQYILYQYLQESARIAQTLMESDGDVDLSTIITPDTVRMTVTAVITIPILLVYPFMQRFFIKGITVGAVKG